MVRLWVVGSAILTFLLASANWQHFQSGPLVSVMLFPYLVFPWFPVVMFLGVNPISGSRAEPLADGFLSRPVTRHEYLLAIWAARVVVVLGAYLLVMVPATMVVVLARRPAPADTVTVYGLIAALCVVAIVLILQVSLSFLLGTLLRRSIPAVLVLLFLWYPVSGVLHTFKLEYFSPISLSQAMPSLLRQPWRGENAPSVAASELPGEIRLDGVRFEELLSGQRKQESFFESTAYTDVSLLRVALGYGIPTGLALGLSLLVFSMRDL